MDAWPGGGGGVPSVADWPPSPSPDTLAGDGRGCHDWWGGDPRPPLQVRHTNGGGGGAPDSDRIVPITDLPAWLRPAFADFRYFNLVQSECFALAYAGGGHAVVTAPTGAGKTGVLELAVARLLASRPPGTPGRAKAVYLAPMRALIHERLADWRRRFGPLGIKVAELTGDVGEATDGGLTPALTSADLICATPEKLDAVTRVRRDRRGAARRFVSDVGLVLVDEVHLLGEDGRGATLEAVVSRLKAVGARPEMAGHPIASARFVAVSATIPNIASVGAWLGAGPGSIKVFGDEVRPVPLHIVVRGYPPTPTDFLFEKRLNEHLPGILAEHGGSGRPALIFCSSRKGAADTAAHLAATGVALGALQPGAGAELAATAGRLANRALAGVLARGVGFHHAGLEPGDRSVVEGLFASRRLPLLCSTATLAQGVNLPAYLVILKGTRRWASAAERAGVGVGGVGVGGPSDAAQPGPSSGGFEEYDRSAVLQMAGRAGRPQFDRAGVAVVMTTAAAAPRYRALACGGEPLESALAPVVAEALNAEVAGGTVVDVPGAAAWLRTTFLAARAAANPGAYGLRPGLAAAALDAAAVDRFVLAPLRALARAGMVHVSGAAHPLSAALAPTDAGALMAAHCIRLNTMASLLAAPRRSSLPDLLDIITRADELAGPGGVCGGLRRGDKKPLNALNKAAGVVAGGGGASFFVPAPGRPDRPKDRVATPAEKLFILINDALAGGGPSDGLDWSLRAEAEGAVRVARRVAAAGARLWEGRRALAAAANGARLARALSAGCWDGSAAECRQLPGIGRVLGARLAAAGLGTLRALRSADGRRIEAVTGKAFPFGAQVAAEVAALAPPAVTLTVSRLPGGGAGGVAFEVVLARTAGGAAGGGGEGEEGAAAPPAATPARRRASYAKLLVGSLHDDALLHSETVDLATFASPYTVRLRARVGGGGGSCALPPLPGLPPGRARVVAAALPERVVGFDVTTSVDLGTPDAVGEGGGAAAAAAAVPPTGVVTGEAVDVAEEAADPPLRPPSPAAPSPPPPAAAVPSPPPPAAPPATPAAHVVAVDETPNPYFDTFRFKGGTGEGQVEVPPARPVVPPPARRSTGGGPAPLSGSGRTAALREAGLLSSEDEEGPAPALAAAAAASPLPPGVVEPAKKSRPLTVPALALQARAGAPPPAKKPAPAAPDPDFAATALAALARAGLVGKPSGEGAAGAAAEPAFARLQQRPQAARRAAAWDSDSDDELAL